MFYGEYEHSLDNKDRVIIPAKFREIFKERYVERFFITRGLDQCLFVFTEETWKAQEKRFRDMPFTRSESRKFNRLFFSGAAEVVCDKQGRILIPAYLKTYAEVKTQVMIIGVSDRIEIWAKDKWASFYDGNKGSFEDLAEKLIMGVDILRFQGDLDAMEMVKMKNRVARLVKKNRKKLLFDLSCARRVELAGLGILIDRLMKIRAVKGDIKLCNLRPEVEKTLAMVGINRLMESFQSEEEAVRSFAA
jgi:MraZ protein